jgi:hypothetical protein
VSEPSGAGVRATSSLTAADGVAPREGAPTSCPTRAAQGVRPIVTLSAVRHAACTAVVAIIDVEHANDLGRVQESGKSVGSGSRTRSACRDRHGGCRARARIRFVAHAPRPPCVAVASPCRHTETPEGVCRSDVACVGRSSVSQFGHIRRLSAFGARSKKRGDWHAPIGGAWVANLRGSCVRVLGYTCSYVGWSSRQ